MINKKTDAFTVELMVSLSAKGMKSIFYTGEAKTSLVFLLKLLGIHSRELYHREYNY